MEIKNAREEEIKNVVAKELFGAYDCTKIIGNIDFCVCAKPNLEKNQMTLWEETISLVWGEAKRGVKADIYASFVQLILTIGKAKTFNKYAPPLFLVAFDAEKIAFVSWDKVQHVFSMNDFNWNITASDHESKYFKLLYSLIKENLEKESLLFYYAQDKNELKEFIEENLNNKDFEDRKILVDKNNFYFIYQKWLERVKPTISIPWDEAKKRGILDVDFYLADLISEEDNTLLEKLRVVLQYSKYKLKAGSDGTLGELFFEYGFTDSQRAYKRFWNVYERPPKKEYWNYIIDRRDILIPQDFRIRKGAFYTPQKWVELSQKYLANVLGENWQEGYYIWDCAAGTGNLLNGLTEKYRVYASTLDMADVDVMREKIKSNASNLLEEHVFQFDFLNDDFNKLPSSLQEIINDKEKRKRLVIYINPPYAEAATNTTITGSGEHKPQVSNTTITHQKYVDILQKGIRELFVQFLIRIYKEIPGCLLAEFSTLKILQASNFKDFRNVFKAELKSLFLVPAKSFDNVKGDFPIGFFIWDTNKKKQFESITAEVYDKDGVFQEQKVIKNKENLKYLNQWLKLYIDEKGKEIGGMCCIGADYQQNAHVNIDFLHKLKGAGNAKGIAKFRITPNNILFSCIYFATRLCVEATWLNNRDQFFYPNNDWKKDKEFQSDCLIFTLFHGQNRIRSKEGVNNWIPFKEKDVKPRERYKSHFMIDFLNGKIKPNKEKQTCITTNEITEKDTIDFSEPIINNLSLEAKEVFDSAKELWKYYHSQKNSNADASFYDIREYFQGRAKNGRMNNNSTDEKYNTLINDLREKQKLLAKKISQKAYEYEFLQPEAVL